MHCVATMKLCKALYYRVYQWWHHCFLQAPLTEESWEARNKQNTSIAAGDEYYDYYLPDEDTISSTEQTMELLVADDPAYYSDQFSNPDDNRDDEDDEGGDNCYDT